MIFVPTPRSYTPSPFEILNKNLLVLRLGWASRSYRYVMSPPAAQLSNSSLPSSLQAQPSLRRLFLTPTAFSLTHTQTHTHILTPSLSLSHWVSSSLSLSLSVTLSLCLSLSHIQLSLSPSMPLSHTTHIPQPWPPSGSSDTCQLRHQLRSLRPHGQPARCPNAPGLCTTSV